MSSNPSFLHNPFLTPWLGAAELARKQAAMLTEFNRQALQFWTGGLLRAAATTPKAVEAPKAAPALVESPAAIEAAPAPLEAKPAPATSPVAQPEAVAKPARMAEARVRTAKPAQTLRTASHGRKTAKKRPASPSSRITRH